MEAFSIVLVRLFLLLSLTFLHLKGVREECEKLKETVSLKDKKLARMNKAFGNKVKKLLEIIPSRSHNLCCVSVK